MSHIRTKTIGEACFWLGLVIEILIVIVDKSAYTNPLESQLFRLTFLLFCIKIALTKYSAGEWLCMLLFGAVMFVSYRINERDEAVRIIAFIAACKGMDIKKVMRVVCWVTFAGCAALVLLSVTGIYGKVAVTANFGREVQPDSLRRRATCWAWDTPTPCTACSGWSSSWQSTAMPMC